MRQRRRFSEEEIQRLYARYNSLLERVDALERKLFDDLIQAGHRLTELDVLTRRVDAQATEVERLWSIIDDLTEEHDQ